MYNDIMKIAVEQMAQSLGKDEAFVVNNFYVSLRFKVIKQDVEVEVVTTDKGLSLVIKNTSRYGNWESTPVMIIDPSLSADYDPDREIMLLKGGVTADQIDSLIESNNCTYIETIFKGRHDSDEYLGAVQIREATLSLTVNPGV